MDHVSHVFQKETLVHHQPLRVKGWPAKRPREARAHPKPPHRRGERDTEKKGQNKTERISWVSCLTRPYPSPNSRDDDISHCVALMELCWSSCMMLLLYQLALWEMELIELDSWQVGLHLILAYSCCWNTVVKEMFSYHYEKAQNFGPNSHQEEELYRIYNHLLLLLFCVRLWLLVAQLKMFLSLPFLLQ